MKTISNASRNKPIIKFSSAYFLPISSSLSFSLLETSASVLNKTFRRENITFLFGKHKEKNSSHEKALEYQMRNHEDNVDVFRMKDGELLFFINIELITKVITLVQKKRRH